MPVLIIHGTADEVVPLELGKRLAKTKGPPRIEWWQVQGGRHLDLNYVLGRTYYDRMETFARKATGGG